MALMVFPSAGLAQSSIGGYNDVGGDVQNQVSNPDDNNGGVAGTQDSGGEPPAAAAQPVSSSESLPFTGLDLALLVGAGATLVGLGLLMRRFTRGIDTA